MLFNRPFMEMLISTSITAKKKITGSNESMKTLFCLKRRERNSKQQTREWHGSFAGISGVKRDI